MGVQGEGRNFFQKVPPFPLPAFFLPDLYPNTAWAKPVRVPLPALP